MKSAAVARSKPLLAIALGVGICSAFAMFFALIDVPSLEHRDSKDARNAYIAAREFCKRSLQSPTTAKFSSGKIGEDDDLNMKAEHYEGVWCVTGVVDSQNSFGTMVHSPWGARVEHLPTGWKIIEMTLDGERLISRPETGQEKKDRLSGDFQDAQEREKQQRAKEIAPAQRKAGHMAAIIKATH